MSWSDLGLPDVPDDGEPEGTRAPTPDAAPANPAPATSPLLPDSLKPLKPPKPPKPPREPKPAREPRGPKPPREPGDRTPLILGIIAGVLLVAVGVTLAIALNRPSTTAPPATTAPTAAPTTARPSPSTTPSPDAVGEPVALDFSGTGFTLVDENGKTAFTFAWRDDVAGAVAALTDAFGAAPTTRVEPGDGSHYPDYTVYQWNGFMLFDMIPTPGGTTRADYTQPTYVLFSRGEVGGITLKAEHGLTIGSTIAAVQAAGPDADTPRGNVGAIRFTFDQARSGTEGGKLQYSMFADTDGTAVTAILYYFASNL